ncbi:hypothetical protein P280DRAFT_292031 [Massarina eburnea CBS 473.64]|uniref:Zn(2)-C6 fungal-type domain-containing protein n=1 Tax=Massarina eburnea CBS 473.64 TaxID=1395130 RepID=A0A6A6S4J5_9PLEO|nr:hypothetical protein P280DRAFT_292031 [Massarina eburnea CBS 473.64]
MSVPRARPRNIRPGCRTCRVRRVKCDLGRPICGNCIRVHRECSFRLFDPEPQSAPLSRNPSPTNALIPIQEAPSPSLPDPTFLDSAFHVRVLEDIPDLLRPQFKHLLRHFALETCGTITHDSKAQSAWNTTVPQLASKHRFVKQGIFAISAMHLSRTVSSQRERKHFQDIATIHMNSGLIQYRKAIEKVTEKNSAALFTFSVMITSLAVLNTTEECSNLLQSIRKGRQSTTERDTAIEEMVRATSNMMFCFRGVLVILVPCWHTLVKGPLAPILERDWWPRPIPSSPQAIEEDNKLKNIERIWQHPGRQYEYWYDTLTVTLQRLRDSFALISLLTMDGLLIDWSAPFNWAVQTSPSFIDLLVQKKPEAWVIIAHYAILPSKIPAIWWVDDFAPSLVSAAALVIGEEMWDWIEWPASVVGVDLDSLRPRDDNEAQDVTSMTSSSGFTSSSEM